MWILYIYTNNTINEQVTFHCKLLSPRLKKVNIGSLKTDKGRGSRVKLPAFGSPSTSVICAPASGDSTTDWPGVVEPSTTARSGVVDN